MKYRLTYSIQFRTPVTSLPNEIRLRIREGEFVLHDVDDEGRTGKADITVPVDDLQGLTVRDGETPLDGGPAQKGIHVPESSSVGGIMRSAVRALEFALEVAIDAASRLGEETLLTESEADEERLKALCSLPVFVELHAIGSIHVLPRITLDAATLEKLLSREVGLALYSDALHLSTPIGRFREFWRVLESAFCQSGRALVASLAKYPPAQSLQFCHKELKKLLILRGQVSHAESSLKVYQRFSKEVVGRLPRLESLAVEVLMTKKTWGTKGAGVERLAPLRTYVNKEGNSVLLQQSHKSGDKDKGA